MAANVTSCVATTDNGTSWRGNRTFLTNAELSTSDRDPIVSDVEKNSHSASPTSR